MGWLLDRLTVRRVAAVALILGLTLLVLALGDPLAHPQAGDQADGQRGLVGVPRVVELAALAIAVVLALPPRKEES